MIGQLKCDAGCLWCTDSPNSQRWPRNKTNNSEARGEKAVLKCHDWMNQKTCQVWLGCRNIPQSSQINTCARARAHTHTHTHTHTLLPAYSLCLVTVTKLCCPGQGFVSHTNQNKDPITALPPSLPPTSLSPSLHLLSSSTPLSCPPLMRWWVYFLCSPPLASVHPLIHRLQEGLGGSPVVPYIPLPWQQSRTKAARQYNTGVLSFTGFMGWY